MRVSFGDLRIGPIAKKYIERALNRSWVSQGPNVEEFEKRFAQKFSYKHAIATSSGTDACICACAALYDFGAKRGDEIIVPACTFVAPANAVLAAGFIPKFVDIELETLNIDPSKVVDAISERTIAIMPVHLMGKPAPMDELRNLDLWVLEDACEAHGAQYKGRYVGAIGHVGAFSFYAAHLIVAGEGGMVVTNDDRFAEVLKSVRSHGRPAGSNYFDFVRFGFNSRMNDLTAAVGIEGIIKFDETFRKRRENLKRLLELTKDLGEYCHFLKEAPLPPPADYTIASVPLEVVSPHAFPLVLRDQPPFHSTAPRWDRDRLYHYLEEKGIQCKTLFGSLPTQHAAFRWMGHELGEFPVAEYVGQNGLHFGIHQYLSDDDLCYVAEVLRKYFKG